MNGTEIQSQPLVQDHALRGAKVPCVPTPHHQRLHPICTEALTGSAAACTSCAEHLIYCQSTLQWLSSLRLTVRTQGWRPSRPERSSALLRPEQACARAGLRARRPAGPTLRVCLMMLSSSSGYLVALHLGDDEVPQLQSPH